MNRRGFLGLILGTTVGALFLKATTRPEPVAVPKGPVWITDPNCPDDKIFFVDSKLYGYTPTNGVVRSNLWP